MSQTAQRSFEEELGVAPERLDLISEELESFEFGTDAYRERRKELASVIVDESIAATGRQFSGKSLEVERRLRQALIEGVLIGSHIRSSLIVGSAETSYPMNLLQIPQNEHKEVPYVESSALMYAIAFDLDTAALEQNYWGASWRNGYKEIEDILDRHGFEQKQGSVYYGNETINVVKTIVAVQDLSRCLPWFKESVKDIRILQLLGNDDLKPLL